MDVMSIANSPAMWIACGIPVLFVIFQAVLFLRERKKILLNLRPNTSARNIEIYRLLNYRVFLGSLEERNAYLTTSFSKLT